MAVSRKRGWRERLPGLWQPRGEGVRMHPNTCTNSTGDPRESGTSGEAAGQ